MLAQMRENVNEKSIAAKFRRLKFVHKYSVFFRQEILLQAQIFTRTYVYVFGILPPKSDEFFFVFGKFNLYLFGTLRKDDVFAVEKRHFSAFVVVKHEFLRIEPRREIFGNALQNIVIRAEKRVIHAAFGFLKADECADAVYFVPHFPNQIVKRRNARVVVRFERRSAAREKQAQKIEYLFFFELIPAQIRVQHRIVCEHSALFYQTVAHAPRFFAAFRAYAKRIRKRYVVYVGRNRIGIAPSIITVVNRGQETDEIFFANENIHSLICSFVGAPKEPKARRDTFDCVPNPATIYF